MCVRVRVYADGDYSAPFTSDLHPLLSAPCARARARVCVLFGGLDERKLRLSRGAKLSTRAEAEAEAEAEDRGCQRVGR